MLAGIADEHVHSAIVAGLRQCGMDVLTVQDMGLDRTDDERLLEIATDQGKLMLSCDGDFKVIHAKWMRSGRDHAGICFWKADRADYGNIIRKIQEYAVHTSPQDACNDFRYV